MKPKWSMVERGQRWRYSVGEKALGEVYWNFNGWGAMFCSKKGPKSLPYRSASGSDTCWEARRAVEEAVEDLEEEKRLRRARRTCKIVPDEVQRLQTPETLAPKEALTNMAIDTEKLAAATKELAKAQRKLAKLAGAEAAAEAKAVAKAKAASAVKIQAAIKSVDDATAVVEGLTSTTSN